MKTRADVVGSDRGPCYALLRLRVDLLLRQQMIGMLVLLVVMLVLTSRALQLRNKSRLDLSSTLPPHRLVGLQLLLRPSSTLLPLAAPHHLTPR